MKQTNKQYQSFGQNKENVKEPKKRITKQVIYSNVKSLVIILVLVLAFKSSVMGNYKIPSGSMEPTLLIGDRIFANQLAYSLRVPFTNFHILDYNEPETGDIIVFKYPKDPSKDYVKRVIGVPGDIVTISDGNLYINNVEMKVNSIGNENLSSDLVPYREKGELYKESLDDINHFILLTQDVNYSFTRNFGPKKVPDNMYFVMGDNRDRSSDSRSWGFVPKNLIKAKVLISWFSSSWDWPSLPKVKFNRIGKIIK